MKDPQFNGISNVIIIDEAHERKIQIDFLLYLLRNTLKLRKDFKIIIMSATINEGVFEQYFKDFKCGKINITGKTNYPIQSIFLDNPIKNNEYIKKGYEIIKEILKKDNKNSILFFVTSVMETFEVCKLLKSLDNCVEIYSGMDINLNNIDSTNNQKIYIATNISILPNH